MNTAGAGFRNFANGLLFSVNGFQQVAEFVRIDISQLPVRCRAYDQISKIIDGQNAVEEIASLPAPIPGYEEIVKAGPFADEPGFRERRWQLTDYFGRPAKQIRIERKLVRMVIAAIPEKIEFPDSLLIVRFDEIPYLMLVDGIPLAQQPYNMGNMLWGLKMHRLGFSLPACLLGAHAYTIYGGMTGKYPKIELDSFDDQCSIILGYMLWPGL